MTPLYVATNQPLVAPEVRAPLRRDPCTCVASPVPRPLGQDAPLCPACAAWQAGWALWRGKRVMRRETWVWEHSDE